MLTAQPLDFEQVRWDALDALPDRTVFQSREWIGFVAETQGATPVVAELRDGRELVGYFTGLTVRRFGVKILGSSFPGWTTPYMGFNLLDGTSPREAVAAVERLAFGRLRCLHLEVCDRHLTARDGTDLGFESDAYHSYESDLTQSESALWSGMTSACRRCIRKAEREGVTIEPAHDGGFADEYYAQLRQVFARQGLVPTYPVERVRALIRHLAPSGRLLLLRARARDGQCIGTGIYPAWNRIAEFWGNASVQSRRSLRPNEALHWFAMRAWKARGIERLDWGGRGDYKEKYGPRPLQVVRLAKSRWRVLPILRELMRRLVAARQRYRGRHVAMLPSDGEE